MGAATFETTQAGASAQEAFSQARERARWMHGHGGYTGTIAEKHSFVMIRDSWLELQGRYASLDPDARCEHTARQLVQEDRRVIGRALIELDDRRISSKYGPAGCVDLGPIPGEPLHEFLFFGWAAE